MSANRRAGAATDTATRSTSTPAYTSPCRTRDTEPDASSTPPTPMLSSAVAARVWWRPRRGMATKPLAHAPAMAPRVLTAYAVPTLRPTARDPDATILLTSGKVAPMHRVGGRITAKVFRKVSQSGAPQYALLKPSHQASRP